MPRGCVFDELKFERIALAHEIVSNGIYRHTWGHMISADQYPVAEVLGDKFVHEIPPYQRPYAWTSEQALQLIDDLREAMTSEGEEPPRSGRRMQARSSWAIFPIGALRLTGTGAAVTALNLSDFDPNDILFVSEMIEPIVMDASGLVRPAR
jgi:hypothetical protein